MGAPGADLANGCFRKGVWALRKWVPLCLLAGYDAIPALTPPPFGVEECFKRWHFGLSCHLLRGDQPGNIKDVERLLLLAWAVGLAPLGPKGRAKLVPQKSRPGVVL